MQLNLGCGPDHLSGFVNVDHSPVFDTDLCFDIQRPWPLPSNSVHFILAKHVLEHCVDLIPTMNEAWRVLAPKAKIDILSPHYLHPWAYGDPSHVRFFSDESFFPFSVHASRFRHLGILCAFTLLLNETTTDPHRDIPGHVHVILQKLV